MAPPKAVAMFAVAGGPDTQSRKNVLTTRSRTPKFRDPIADRHDVTGSLEVGITGQFLVEGVSRRISNSR